MDAKKRLLQIGLILALGLVALIWFASSEEAAAPSEGAASEAILAEDDDNSQPQDSQNTADSRELATLKEFTSLEFKEAYDAISLPNITPIVSAPSITGDDRADARIQRIAEERGYQLRDVASGVLNEIDEKPVQELLISSWLDLQQMAVEEGISVQFRSGYRSVEEQRDLFLDRLYATGATIAGIRSGADDVAIDAVLATTAPPGYSRHHGGYTIDVEDPGFAVFAQSTAYAWMSANNFEKAKLHGFIPSYPNGLTNQGPNPEPWEFVWVSQNVTYE